jgi:hypothetical protein
MLLREAEALRHADYQTATGVPAFHQTLPSHLRPRRAKQHCSRQRPRENARLSTPATMARNMGCRRIGEEPQIRRIRGVNGQLPKGHKVPFSEGIRSVEAICLRKTSRKPLRRLIEPSRWRHGQLGGRHPAPPTGRFIHENARSSSAYSVPGQAAETMMRVGLRRVPVTHDGKLVGIISHSDIIHLLAPF